MMGFWWSDRCGIQPWAQGFYPQRRVPNAESRFRTFTPYPIPSTVYHFVFADQCCRPSASISWK
jgi:hypothetical protein